MEEPYFVCHKSHYDHFMERLRTLDFLMDTHLILSGNEVESSHSFMLAALSGCIQSLPRNASSNSTTYLILRELDPWSVRCLLEYFYSGSLVIPRHSLPSMNRVLQTLDISLGSEFYENSDSIQFSLSQISKCNIINSMWLNRAHNHDVKILTEGMHETYAHAAVLSLCSDQFSTLFRAAQGCKPALIVLLDFHLQDVECILKYCYKGEVDINGDRADKVCKLAKILGINGFKGINSFGYLGDNNNLRNNTSDKVITKISCWEHKGNTRKIFRTLFEKECLSDIQLICSDHTFKVHSAVLNLSPYFKQLFEFPDWRHSLVFLSNLSLDTVQAFVDYMYYGEVLFNGYHVDFVTAMNGLIDFNVLPANSVEEQWVHAAVPMSVFEAPPPPLSVTSEPAVLPLPEPQVDIKKNNETHSTPLTYTCDTCSVTFYSRRSLKLHLKVSHPESRCTKCEFCDEEFDRPSLRKLHELTHTGTKPLVCLNCGKTYSSQSSLNKHTKAMHKEGVLVLVCELCGRKCSRKEYLEEHIRTHTGTKPYACSLCNKQFVGRTGLNHHIKTHRPPRKDSVCEVCGKAFTRKALWTHIKSHNKQYKCELCNKVFSTPGTLKAHTAMNHIETKLFVCETCGKKFALRNHLTRHVKNVHKPDKRFPCTSCDKILSSEVNLRSHEHTAHAKVVQRYGCDICDRQFAGRSGLIYHQRTHSGIRPHVCQHCSKAFLRPDALTKHLRSHSQERPYSCTVCEQKCSSKSSLNQHMKRHIVQQTGTQQTN